MSARPQRQDPPEDFECEAGMAGMAIVFESVFRCIFLLLQNARIAMQNYWFVWYIVVAWSVRQAS